MSFSVIYSAVLQVFAGSSYSFNRFELDADSCWRFGDIKCYHAPVRKTVIVKRRRRNKSIV